MPEFNKLIHKLKVQQTGSFRNTCVALAILSASVFVNAETFQVVYHVVEKGETLSELSKRFGVSSTDLKKLNDFSSDQIKSGQKLLIPINKIVTGKSQSGKIITVDASSNQNLTKDKYKVVFGDTLSGIAITHKVSLSSLLKANGISANHPIKANDYLIIPSRQDKAEVNKSATERKSRNPTRIQKPLASVPKSNTYKVKSGDILLTIANAHQVAVTDIMISNGMSSDFLRAGQILKIPSVHKNQNTQSGKLTNTLPKSTKSSVVTYKVKAGDVLGTIAEMHGVSFSELVKLNKLEGKEDSIKANQTIKIPSKDGDDDTSNSVQPVESKPRIRDTVNKVVGSTGY